MKPHWHALSAVHAPELGSWASPGMLALMLRAGPVELRYGGDRMWPAVRHGQPFRAVPVTADGLRRGRVVVAGLDGAADLLRVVRALDGGRLELQGDADPDELRSRPVDAVLACTDLPRILPAAAARLGRRLGLDLREAWVAHADATADGAATVRDKYDAQAGHYARVQERAVEAELLERLRRRIPRGGSILVAGSGSGRECFELAEEGWAVRGVDFSPAMVDAARRGAARLGLDVPFVQADLRRHDEPAGSLAAVLFTYDVYSFLPDEADRTALLGRMGRWLAPGGAIFLSARCVGRPWQRWVLTVQWMRRRGGRWGASHTRYLTPDGTLHRSFLHYFTPARLRREIVRAGLRPGPTEAGHIEVRAGTRPGTAAKRETRE